MRASRFRRKLRRTRRRVRRRQKASLRAASLRAAKLKHSKKKSTRKRSGGTSPTISTTATQSYGFDNGSSPRSNAAGFQTSQNAAQQSLNSTHGGAKRRRGGSATSRPKSLDVPQFSQQGPDIGPQNANNTSVATNTSAVAGTVNASNDCYATNSCGATGGSRRTRKAGKRGSVKWGCMSGGRKKRSGGSKRVSWGCMS
jgi:hypothetical protein